jgi:hypothetical protein
MSDGAFLALEKKDSTKIGGRSGPPSPSEYFAVIFLKSDFPEMVSSHTLVHSISDFEKEERSVVTRAGDEGRSSEECIPDDFLPDDEDRFLFVLFEILDMMLVQQELG